MSQEEIEVFEGSGNVFEDFEYPDSAEAKVKADIAIQIKKIISSSGMTQEEAGTKMGIEQPKVSDIVRGKLSQFTLDRLFRFLNNLGQEIEIRAKKKTNRSTKPMIRFIGEGDSSSEKKPAKV